MFISCRCEYLYIIIIIISSSSSSTAFFFFLVCFNYEYISITYYLLPIYSCMLSGGCADDEVNDKDELYQEV